MHIASFIYNPLMHALKDKHLNKNTNTHPNARKYFIFFLKRECYVSIRNKNANITTFETPFFINCVLSNSIALAL